MLMTIDNINTLLSEHGIDGIYDDSTGSRFADDIDTTKPISLHAVKQWLGY